MQYNDAAKIAAQAWERIRPEGAPVAPDGGPNAHPPFNQCDPAHQHKLVYQVQSLVSEQIHPARREPHDDFERAVMRILDDNQKEAKNV